MACNLASIKALFPKQACDMSDSELLTLFNNSVMPDLKRYIYSNFPNEFIQTHTINLTSGTDTYPLPLYASILSVTDSKCVDLCKIDPLECALKKNSYYISGGNIVFSSDRNITSVTVKYLKPIASVTSVTDPLPISEQLCMELTPLITSYLLGYYFRQEGMMEDSNKYIEQASSLMDASNKYDIIKVADMSSCGGSGKCCKSLSPCDTCH